MSPFGFFFAGRFSLPIQCLLEFSDFLFILESVLVFCISYAVCPFHLSGLTCWHKLFVTSFFILVGPVLMTCSLVSDFGHWYPLSLFLDQFS